VAIYDRPLRADNELRALLQLLRAGDGACPDVALRRELLDTGFVRPDAELGDAKLHLTPEGIIFLNLR
jgi:hypothetical protein